MVTLGIILLLVCGLTGIVGYVITYISESDAVGYTGLSLLILGIVGMVAGFILAIIGTSSNDSNLDRKCEDKGGVVTQDGMCFVDNHPVQFEPGVWEK